jgi:hypothetical protein
VREVHRWLPDGFQDQAEPAQSDLPDFDCRQWI